MKLIIYINETFEEEKALYDLDNEVVLLKGDYYHDKIDEKIEGFLMGLKYCGRAYELEKSQCVAPNMEVFEKCWFLQ